MFLNFALSLVNPLAWANGGHSVKKDVFKCLLFQDGHKNTPTPFLYANEKPKTRLEAVLEV